MMTRGEGRGHSPPGAAGEGISTDAAAARPWPHARPGSRRDAGGPDVVARAPALAVVTRTFLATWMLVVLATTGACHRSTAAAPAPTTRSPAEVSRDGNHLLGSGSAYLQMHAHNPVDWYPWGPEALTRARAESKPVFLSIGYASCHWCHVMAEEVFEKDDVAALLNARYVAIKVDREERPDLDRTYLRAVEAMTGSAGWPATLFLTEALEPFFGATYLDHDRFLDIARRGADAYAGSRSDVKRQVETLRARLKRDDAPSTGSAVSAPELHALAAEVVDHVDLVSGGFEGHTKFPTPVRWRFVLDAARKYGDSRFVTALRTTLDAMASAGLRDPLGGGFHRYATEPTWRVPHFEKMLYDNAQLADLYLEAGVALRETRYIEIGRETLDFLLRETPTAMGARGRTTRGLPGSCAPPSESETRSSSPTSSGSRSTDRLTAHVRRTGVLRSTGSQRGRP
jgi:hypothetical protein